MNTYAVGNTPFGAAFDGTNIWVTNSGDNTVSKLSVTTGATVATYPTGAGPLGIAFDGANMWIANNSGNNVTKIPAN